MEEALPLCEEFRTMVYDAFLMGITHMDNGRPYSPPDNDYLRRAYSLGWAEAIMGTVTPEEEVIEEVLGCQKE